MFGSMINKLMIALTAAAALVLLWQGRVYPAAAIVLITVLCATDEVTGYFNDHASDKAVVWSMAAELMIALVAVITGPALLFISGQRVLAVILSAVLLMAIVSITVQLRRTCKMCNTRATKPVSGTT